MEQAKPACSAPPTAAAGRTAGGTTDPPTPTAINQIGTQSSVGRPCRAAMDIKTFSVFRRTTSFFGIQPARSLANRALVQRYTVLAADRSRRCEVLFGTAHSPSLCYRPMILNPVSTKIVSPVIPLAKSLTKTPPYRHFPTLHIPP